MIRRCSKLLLKVLLVICLLFFAFLLFERIRGQVLLASYKRELISRGEKLTAKDLMSPVATDQNGAPEVFARTQELKEGTVFSRYCPPRMQLTPSGRAIVGFQESLWVEGKVTNHWAELAADLETNKQTLIRIRVALEKPVLNNQLDYSLGCDMPLTNLSTPRTLTYWFGAGSQLALHEDKTHQALDDLVAHIRLPRLLAEDRLAISELVRDAVAAIAKTATWEAMQADGWRDEDLSRIQEAWRSQAFATTLAYSLEGERVYGEASYDVMRKSNDETASMFFWMEAFSRFETGEQPFWESIPLGDKVAKFVTKQVYCRIWRFGWSYQAQKRNLEQHQQLIEIARRAASEKSLAGVQPTVARLVEDSRNRNWYDRLRFPEPLSVLNLSRVVTKALRAETERSIALCAVALKRYALRHGQPPASLDALVPEFMSEVPTDCMDGKMMKYRLQADGSFVLYSVGEDGKDDGGDAALLPDKTGHWSLWDRRDFVWPAPALPEEVEAWRAEAVKN